MCLFSPSTQKLQATALVNGGFLKMLLQLDKVETYWVHMLRDFPGHPARNMPKESAPLCLYGRSTDFLLGWGDNIATHDQSKLFVLTRSRVRGDEGQALGESFMAFHWQPALSPCPKNAGVSRFMITTIPSSHYVSWPNWSDWSPWKKHFPLTHFAVWGLWWIGEFDSTSCCVYHCRVVE